MLTTLSSKNLEIKILDKVFSLSMDLIIKSMSFDCWRRGLDYNIIRSNYFGHLHSGCNFFPDTSSCVEQQKTLCIMFPSISRGMFSELLMAYLLS